MHRLFVGLRPSTAMRSIILSQMGGVPGARWQTDDHLHVTLRFIGEVDRPLAEDVAVALGSVRHRPLDLQLGGVGCFDRKGRIDSLWVAIGPEAEVRSLHLAVGRALDRVGIAPDQRAFVPHITIARFSRTNAPVPPLPIASLSPPSVTARFDHFLLYESHLGREGPTYEVVERYPLA
ncbi:RNA 2',3'-cyclic phosphodiesterase [Rhizorhabdus sp. FW153]|uniref:RNA 2',3'-cyclic phosphodiesterase n=1 Tax=Rhizorhabdus sp. FW153 TaxID=3400216 RepID=UPI003CFACA92